MANKKKVTLSLDSKVYSDFQKYCEENAIMLSKKIEIVMKKILSSKGKESFLIVLTLIFLLNFVSGNIFQDKTQLDFGNGTYNFTFYNVSGFVQLSEGNLTGDYMSRIFDAENKAIWNNLSWQGNNSNIRASYAVDGQGKVYSSSDSGISWTLKNSSYGRTSDTQDMFSDSSGNLYIITNSNKEIWKSTNNGISWVKINDSFSNKNLLVGESDSSNNIYIIAGASTGVVWKSSDSGVSWTQVNASYNDGDGAAKGLTWNGSALYAVDGQGKVYSSSDSGISWTLKNSSYGRTSDTQDMFSDSSGNLYIITNSNKEIWKSTNNGISWVKINDTFSNLGLLTGMSDNNEYLYIIAGTSAGIVYRSSNGGVSWTQVNASYNDGDGAAKGITSVLKQTNLSFQARNCSLADCSDGIWQNVDLSNINLTSRYFQYKVNFSSKDTLITPKLYNVTLNYNILDTIPPNFSDYAESPANNSAYIFGNVYKLNVTVGDDSAIDKIGVEFNNVNYTNGFIANISNVYMFNISNLGAKTYSYRWWANDSYGNLNNSEVRYYTISKADNTPVLLSSVGWTPITYGTEATFSCSAAGTPNLYINNIEVSNPKTIILAAGSYDIKCNISESQNYSAGMSQYTNLIVNRANSQVSLGFDKTSPQIYGTTITPTCSVVSGIGTQVLKMNGNVISSGANLSLGAGTHVFNCSLSESQNYSYSENISSYTINKITGDIKLYLNNLENNLTIDYPEQYNITATTLYGSLTIYKDGINVTVNNGKNITPERSSGYYNITAFSSGDENHSSETITRWINVTLDTISPIISIISPQEGGSYGYNINLTLNYSVTDEHLDSCWYNINNTMNISIANCQNISFNVTVDGIYILYLYANDSLGNLARENSTFSVLVGAPTITLNSPIGIYLNSQNITFRYLSSDLDLDSCELWGDFTGVFALNQTNSTPFNGAENSFNLNLPDGTYRWNVKCNDSLGHSAFNGNKTFHVDTAAPVLSISQPTGNYMSRTQIPVIFSVSDANPGICWYNVHRGVNQEVQNTTINCSIQNSFDVTVDADFVFNLYVSDLAGNKNFLSSSFSVSGSIPPVNPPGGGGGSSGGGGGMIIPSNKSLIGKLEVSKIGEIISQSGNKKTLSLSAKNTGKIFLNNCRLIPNGEISSWIYSQQVEGIAPGENINFIFDLNVPEEAQSKDYFGDLELKCDEMNDLQKIKITIPSGLQSIKIRELKYEKEGLKINYIFENNKSGNEEIKMEIWLVDRDKVEIKRITDSFQSNEGSSIERNVIMELPDDLAGIYSVYFALSSDLGNYVKQSVVLGKPTTTGFTILDEPRNKMVVYGVFLLITGVVVFFVMWGRGRKDKGIKKRMIIKSS